MFTKGKRAHDGDGEEVGGFSQLLGMVGSIRTWSWTDLLSPPILQLTNQLHDLVRVGYLSPASSMPLYPFM